MSRNAVIIGIAVVVLIVGGWFLIRPKQPAISSPDVQPTQTPVSVKAEKNLVKITASGFSLKSIVIKTGESVTWENTDIRVIRSTRIITQLTFCTRSLIWVL